MKPLEFIGDLGLYMRATANGIILIIMIGIIAVFSMVRDESLLSFP